MVAKISRATDSVFQRTAMQDVNAYLGRSDFRDLYNPKHVAAAFADGWHHYPDEPDLLHKTTDRGLTFSIHPYPSTPDIPLGDPRAKPYLMVLHNPEGISNEGSFRTLPEAMKAQREIAENPGKIRDHLKPSRFQSEDVGRLHEAVANGGEWVSPRGITWTTENARDSINRSKAVEDAIAAGGDNLYQNVQDEYRKRGIGT